MRRYEILAKTGFSSGNGVERRIGFCLVRWLNPDGGVAEYSSHMMVDSPDNLVSGDYHLGLQTTVEAFYKRIFEHNQYYRFGNPSHVPIYEFLPKCSECAYFENDGRFCEYWRVTDPSEDSGIITNGCHEFLERK